MQRSLKTNGSLGRHCTHSQAGEAAHKKSEPNTVLRINTSDRPGSDLLKDANQLNKNEHTCECRWRMGGSPEQWFEVTRRINDSGAAAATGKLLCIHQTHSHYFLYCFKLLNNIISNTSHDDQQAHWNFIGTSKHVDFSRQSDEETAMMLGPGIPVGLGSLVRGHTVPASTATHQPAHSLPSLLPSWALPTSQGKTSLTTVLTTIPFPPSMTLLCQWFYTDA